MAHKNKWLAKRGRPDESAAVAQRIDAHFERAKAILPRYEDSRGRARRYFAKASRAARTTIDLAVKGGRQLMKARELVGHGDWQAAVEEKFGNYRTAMTWVQLAENPELVESYKRELGDHATIKGALQAIAAAKGDGATTDGEESKDEKDKPDDDTTDIPSGGGNPFFAPSNETLLKYAKNELIQTLRRAMNDWPDESILMLGVIMPEVLNPDMRREELQFAERLHRFEESIRKIARAVAPVFQNLQAALVELQEEEWIDAREKRARVLRDRCRGEMLKVLRKLKKQEKLTKYQKKVVTQLTGDLRSEIETPKRKSTKRNKTGRTGSD